MWFNYTSSHTIHFEVSPLRPKFARNISFYFSFGVFFVTTISIRCKIVLFWKQLADSDRENSRLNVSIFSSTQRLTTTARKQVSQLDFPFSRSGNFRESRRLRATIAESESRTSIYFQSARHEASTQLSISFVVVYNKTSIFLAKNKTILITTLAGWCQKYLGERCARGTKENIFRLHVHLPCDRE